ncbi:MAG: hypothetical protein PGN13_13105 [Patulibacter minatonensis]
MPFASPHRLIRRLALVVAAAAGAHLTLGAAPAAAGTFPVIESFSGSSAPGWTLGGSATLTAPTDGNGSGWLRLTPAQTNRSGYAFYDQPFPSDEGVVVDFDYASYGGTGADGIAFFLYDGTTTAQQFQIGAFGGSLGYTGCGSTPGLRNAYVGIGLDEYGNFANLATLCSGMDGAAFRPNTVVVRGSQAANYKMLGTAAVAKGIQGNRTAARHVTLSLTPAGRLSVTIRFPDGTVQQAVSDLQLPAPPSTLKLGYAAATGGSTNIHEIRTSAALKPTDLHVALTDGAAAAARADARTWTATVTNGGPNPATGVDVKATTPVPGLAGIAWSCAATAGADCGATASGTGLPSVSAGAMPVGATLTYTITGTPAAGADTAQLTVDAQPTGDSGDLVPSDNRATDATDLTPEFDGRPTVAFDASGGATATATAPRGGHTTSTFAWLRCDPAGDACAPIPGATGSSYTVVAADRGQTLRARQTATNAAGSASRDSLAASGLPATVLTAAPTGTVRTADVRFTFTTLAPGATYECRVDTATWSACASPYARTVTGDGAHTFSVRAISGGRPDPTPPTATWTLDATAPTTQVRTTLPALTTSRSATVEVDTADSAPGPVLLECSLDGAPFAVCGAPVHLSDLADGPHTPSPARRRRRRQPRSGSGPAGLDRRRNRPDFHHHQPARGRHERGRPLARDRHERRQRLRAGQPRVSARRSGVADVHLARVDRWSPPTARTPSASARPTPPATARIRRPRPPGPSTRSPR